MNILKPIFWKDILQRYDEAHLFLKNKIHEIEQ